MVLNIKDVRDIYLCTVIADFRGGFDELSNIDDEVYKSGNMIVFCHKAKRRMKFIYFDESIYHMSQVELRRGYINWPVDHPSKFYKLPKHEVEWFFDGLFIRGSKATFRPLNKAH